MYLVATILDNAALEFLPELCFFWAVDNIVPLYFSQLICTQGSINQALIHSLFSTYYGPNTGVGLENAIRRNNSCLQDAC